MSEYERGRRRSHRDYEDGYYYNDEYVPHPRRHRSLGRQALDKLEGALGSLAIDEKDRRRHSPSRHHHDHHHTTGSSRRHHPREYEYRDDRHHRPRDHSRHHHHHHDSHRDHDAHHHRHHSTHRRPYSSSPARHSRGSRRDHSTVGRRTTGTARARSRSQADRGLKAAIDAAAIEAFRVRNEPGGWGGKKGARVATAAVTAATIGAAAEKRKQEEGHSKLGTMGSAMAGLAVNRLVNGPRRDLR